MPEQMEFVARETKSTLFREGELGLCSPEFHSGAFMQEFYLYVQGSSMSLRSSPSITTKRTHKTKMCVRSSLIPN